MSEDKESSDDVAEPEVTGIWDRALTAEEMKVVAAGGDVPGNELKARKDALYLALTDKDGGKPAGKELIEFAPPVKGLTQNTASVVFVMEHTAELAGAVLIKDGPDPVEVPIDLVIVGGEFGLPRCVVAGQEIELLPGCVTVAIEKLGDG